MTHEIIIQLICILYFYFLAVLGLWAGIDLIKDYKWPSPGFKYMALLLFLTSPLFLGILPMVVLGVAAIASIQTGFQEKRKGRK